MRGVQDRLHEAALRLFAERGVSQVTVSDLAQAAGVARGTIYNNFHGIDALFEEVATKLTSDMGDQIMASMGQGETVDPAHRLANGIRFFVRRAHEDPVWGRFIVRFGPSTPTLRTLLESGPSDDIARGVALGRFQLRPDQSSTAVAILSGSALAAMGLVLEGHRTWRDAGSDAAELLLRALGLPPEQARDIATSELPVLRSANG